MYKIAIVSTGLLLIIVSQLLLSMGYEFLMAQRPIDFAHWSLLLGALMMFGLWFTLPANASKKIGLGIMTLGIGGVAGMCMIDFMLWAADSDPDLKEKLFDLISSTGSINIPFLAVGPGMFYGGICIATYGLIKRFTWQVIALNTGGLLIGLGHMLLQNRTIPVIGAVLLLVGLVSIIYKGLESPGNHSLA